MNAVLPWAGESIAMIKKLLSFQAGSDERIAIDAATRELVMVCQP